MGEARELLAAMDEVNQKQLLNAIRNRLPLLEFLTGSPQDAKLLAASIVRHVLANDVGRVLESSAYEEGVWEADNGDQL